MATDHRGDRNQIRLRYDIERVRAITERAPCLRDKGVGQQQEMDMTTQERKINLSDEANRLSIAELDAVSGGRIRWIDIHMLYKDFIKMPVNGPAPTRYA